MKVCTPLKAYAFYIFFCCLCVGMCQHVHLYKVGAHVENFAPKQMFNLNSSPQLAMCTTHVCTCTHLTKVQMCVGAQLC